MVLRYDYILRINITYLIFPNVRFFGLEMMPKTVFEKCWDYPTTGRCANLTIGYHERMMNCTQLVVNTQLFLWGTTIIWSSLTYFLETFIILDIPGKQPLQLISINWKPLKLAIQLPKQIVHMVHPDVFQVPGILGRYLTEMFIYACILTSHFRSNN